LDKHKIIIRGVRLEDSSAGRYEEDTPGTKPGGKDEPLTLYGQKVRMTLAKTKEQEPTAVKKRIWKLC
jgi:hypothetical protein